jgi:hypothetical protein
MHRFGKYYMHPTDRIDSDWLLGTIMQRVLSDGIRSDRKHPEGVVTVADIELKTKLSAVHLQGLDPYNLYLASCVAFPSLHFS